ncbi:MAG: tetratricopeptide repeat protein [Planctomycetota bacterium]
MSSTTSLGGSLAAAAFAGALVAGVVVWALVPAPAPAPAPMRQPEAKWAAIEAQLADLDRRLTALADRVSGEAREALSGAPTDADLHAAVERAVARALAPSGDGAPSAPALDVARVMRDLANPSLSDDAKQALWQEVRASGEIDRVVEQFEQLAAAAPADSMRQTELAWAYQHRMLAASDGPERGKWGGQAAQALTRALELDAQNWDARFSLAQHSYYAEMRGDAIRHFEILTQQQSRRTPEARHSQAYAWLGNIYMDRGDEAEALRVWNEGLMLFPGDVGLSERLAAHR